MNDIQRVDPVSKKTEQRRAGRRHLAHRDAFDFHEQQALKEEAERGSPRR
ncbi:MAG: hypothetical protein U0470_07320 [Anaerolineae bacterium]